jgi:hypothetical protein
MKTHQKRIALGVLIGLLLLSGVVWLLTKTLGNIHETLYAGQSLTYWQQQLKGRDLGASNQAYAIVNSQVVPQLIDAMFHDTNDSKIRLAVIEVLNGLPGIRIYYATANERRAEAVWSLGELGPAARGAVPALIEALNRKDSGLQEPAIRTLGKIHSDPDVVIPTLIPFLTNSDLNDDAATALGNFGSLAKAAVPKIIPLLNTKDRDAIAAARAALKK